MVGIFFRDRVSVCVTAGASEPYRDEEDGEEVTAVDLMDGYYSDDTDALQAAFDAARGNAGSGKPTMILAHTVKGKGVSFMENEILWHYRTPQGEEYEAALKELEAQRP